MYQGDILNITKPAVQTALPKPADGKPRPEDIKPSANNNPNKLADKKNDDNVTIIGYPSLKDQLDRSTDHFEASRASQLLLLYCAAHFIRFSMESRAEADKLIPFNSIHRLGQMLAKNWGSFHSPLKNQFISRDNVGGGARPKSMHLSVNSFANAIVNRYGLREKLHNGGLTMMPRDKRGHDKSNK